MADVLVLEDGWVRAVAELGFLGLLVGHADCMSVCSKAAKQKWSCTSQIVSRRAS